MGFDALVRKGVSLANTLTASLQDTVTIQQWTGNSSGYGGPSLASSASYSAIIEYKQRVVRDTAGNEVQSPARVFICQPVTANGATGRREPVDPRDKITLPDGETYPIASVNGVADPDTNAPYYVDVYLGAA